MLFSPSLSFRWFNKPDNDNKTDLGVCIHDHIFLVTKSVWRGHIDHSEVSLRYKKKLKRRGNTKIDAIPLNHKFERDIKIDRLKKYTLFLFLLFDFTVLTCDVFYEFYSRHVKSEEYSSDMIQNIWHKTKPSPTYSSRIYWKKMLKKVASSKDLGREWVNYVL